MEEEIFEAGTPIITEGEIGTRFYIILEGRVVVTQWQTPTVPETAGQLGIAKPTTLCTCSEGDSFGELALIHGCKRTSTVTTTSRVVCMTLDALSFQTLFGTMSEILSHKLERDAQHSEARVRSLQPVLSSGSPAAAAAAAAAAHASPQRPHPLRRTASGRCAVPTIGASAVTAASTWTVDRAGVSATPAAPGPAAAAVAVGRQRGASRVPKLVARNPGREAEARHLANRVEALLATGEPSVCLVTGEPGIGKSHLLRELRRCYSESDVKVAHVEAQRYDHEPLSVCLQLLRSLLATFLEVPFEQGRLAHAIHLLPAEV